MVLAGVVSQQHVVRSSALRDREHLGATFLESLTLILTFTRTEMTTFRMGFWSIERGIETIWSEGVTKPATQRLSPTLTHVTLPSRIDKQTAVVPLFV